MDARATARSATLHDGHGDARVMSTHPELYARLLLPWFDHAGRHDLPWQHPREPYRVWLSEVMLQQTQVRVVVAYFERFIQALPTLPDLAAAPQEQVLALWSGLGYYARARNLHAAARLCVEHHGGRLPRDIDALTALPGIGRSTAAAILSQAFGDAHAILDGNVRRVLARVHAVEGWPGLPKVEKTLWRLADAHLHAAALPASRMPDYTQAQMDLGATLCTRNAPACVLCPLQDACAARIEGRVDELPTPRPSKALPQRHAHVLLLEDARGRVLLQQRVPAGVWASLWSLPQFDDADAAREWARQRLDMPRPFEPLDTIAHGFSHYLLDLHPLHARDAASRGIADDTLCWVTRADLASLGVPAPIRTLLESRMCVD